MFTFTNTTLINSDYDQLSGLAKFSSANNVFHVLRAGKFEKDAVKSVYKRVGYNPIYSKAEFTPQSADGIYRISLRLRQVGNVTSVYANAASAFNIKPIHIEFKGNSSASTAAENLVKSIKFYQANLYPFIKCEKTSDNKVIITAADEYVVFDKAVLEKLTSAETSVYPDDQNVYSEVSKATITNGKEGFGTYTNIMKNLRLPTLEALRFGSPTQEELPEIGALYNQYTLEYCKDRGILGSDVVGDTVTSITHHVFFVKQSLAPAFEQVMKDAGLTVTDVTEATPESADQIQLVVPANQSVAKNSSALLKFTVNGVERLSGGIWEVVSGTDKALVTFDGSVIKIGNATTDDLQVKVSYNGVTSSAVKVNITGIE